MTLPSKSLQKEWYKKLKDSGFDDIEDTKHPNMPLKAWHSFGRFNVSTMDREASETYYSLARDLLNTHKFKSKLHKIIWEHHCDGQSNRHIEKLINGVCKKDKIRSIILELVKNIKNE